MTQPFVAGSVQTQAGPVPQIATSLRWDDWWGTVKVRWDIGRKTYKVDPGLYAVGQPDAQSPVLVTANYKLSFDRLRANLGGRDTWLLVLDTDGVNVWCAAGKNTFGTKELAARIQSSGLTGVVTHRRLILPQLSAPGISAHKVKKLSGFEVVYGPIRAEDLPAFLDAGCRATPTMRRKAFPLWERVVLIPVELVAAFKVAIFILPVVFLLGGLETGLGFWTGATTSGLLAVLALLTAIVAGTVLTPALLPWLPGRPFSVKGMLAGLVSGALLLIGWGHQLHNVYEVLAWLLLIPTIAAYLGMNFTGSSTYTSLSGVKKEMRWAVPIQIVAGLSGLGLWLLSLFAA